MSWIATICSMNAGASLTLAALCGAVWRKQRQSRGYLISLFCAATAANFCAFPAWHVPLAVWGVAELPLFLSFVCTAIVVTTAYQVGRGLPRGVHSESEPQIRAKLFNFATDFPDLEVWEWDFERDEIFVPLPRRARWGLPAVGSITLEDLISRCHADDRHAVQRAVNGAIRDGRDFHLEFRSIREDDSVRWVHAYGHVQFDDAAKPRRLTLIGLDVTEQKEAELHARKLRESRQRISHQRTAFLERQIAEGARVDREVIERCAREQKCVAYDLHDGVGQQLVSIALGAKLLEEDLRPRHPDQAEKAAALVKLANEATRQTRLTARSLEADGMADLKTALESLAINIGQNCRVKTIVKSNAAALPISAPAALQLYRITQEAVRNAVEHGAASEVLIQLTVGERDLLLTIQDDGHGFQARTSGGGMGLRIMRYRAQCIGGSCEVHNRPDKGTVVCCRVPFETQASLSTIS